MFVLYWEGGAIRDSENERTRGRKDKDAIQGNRVLGWLLFALW